MNLIKNISFKKKLALLAIILVVGGLSGFKLLNQSLKLPTYQTAIAEKGSLVTSVTASGTVSQGSRASITTQATGIVNQVYVKDGDLVTAGQKIADISLDITSQQKQTAALANYQQAVNSLSSAKNSLNTLQATLFSANQDFINDAVARDLPADDPTYIQQNAQWLAAEGSYKNQQGVIAASQTSVSSAWLTYIQLSPSITAPISGVVSGLTVAPGSPITSQASTSSTTATNSSSSLGTISLERGTPLVSVNLTEIDVVKVKPGQKATLTLDALAGKTFTGKVAAVNTNGSVSSGVTTYPATITFDTSSDNIYPNMAVNATIIIGVTNDVILIPTGAVQTVSGQSSIRVMKNKTQVTSVAVEVGQSNDTQTEILSGVSEGDVVITGETDATTTSTGTTTSPFGNTRGGFGGAGGFGGGGAGGGQRR